MRITHKAIMKKYIYALVAIIALALMQSCSQKSCAAYSQHESNARPSYDQVQ